MVAGGEWQVCRLKAYTSESGGGKDVIGGGRGDRGCDVLIVTAPRAIDGDPPLTTAVGATLLAEVSLPGEPEYSVRILFVESDLQRGGGDKMLSVSELTAVQEYLSNGTKVSLCLSR